MTICVIIPLAADEQEWQTLLPALHAAAQIILASNQPRPARVALPANCRWLHCHASGRAQQMNAAAAQAQQPFLWFLHADSRLPATAFALLENATAAQPDALHYFNLRFYNGGWKMRINEWGVRLRCAWFGNPFGDQGFCLSRKNYERVGGFCERATYGEDHLFALAAQRRGVRLHRLPAAIATSARRYTARGWWRTVLLFQYLWIKQWWQHKSK